MRSIELSLLSFFLLAGGLSVNFISAAEKIDINAAPLEDLVKIIHIGEIRGRELISLRPFSSLDDLVRIKGIGEKRVEDIKNQGLAWVDSQGEPKPEPVKDIPPLIEPEMEILPEPRATSTPSEEPIETESRLMNYPAGVVINEILPSPIGPDAEEEWIEIYNQNDFQVDLSGWQIKDRVGKTHLYIFPEGTIVSPQGFLVLSRPTTKITLNNSGDGLNLIQPDGKVVYTVNYGKAPRGESFNRTPLDNENLTGQAESEWVWSKTPTPESGNIISVPKESKPEESKSAETESPQVMAAVGEQLPQSSNSRLIVLVALALAIFSGTIILVLKKRLIMS
jgi:hypothetical protein